jgi:hypothetical protein
MMLTGPGVKANGLGSFMVSGEDGRGQMNWCSCDCYCCCCCADNFPYSSSSVGQYLILQASSGPAAFLAYNGACYPRPSDAKLHALLQVQTACLIHSQRNGPRRSRWQIGRAGHCTELWTDLLQSIQIDVICSSAM